VDLPTVERLLDAFDAPDSSLSERPPGLAAVLLALYDTHEGPALLYIKRAETLRDHAGEIAFPGGRVDPEDESPRHAALREAWEEVGIEPTRLARVAHLVDYPTFRGTTVSAFVARALDEAPTVPKSREEVDEVFLVPVRQLVDPARYEARRTEGMGPERRVHYWHLRDHILWGITGELTAQFLQRAVGWTLPERVTTVDSIDQILPRSGSFKRG
jgi:8-oxo-dGTP pyrophosphatase MutT (NUDIX family)